MKKMRDTSLYLIITKEYCCGLSVLEVAKRAIAGGVDMIQLRDKNSRAEEVLNTAKALRKLCNDKAVAFIVNDDPVLARNVDADGVHLGQEDLLKFSVRQARDILGKGKIIGISTSSIEEIEKANGEEIDYIGFGPVFTTAIKQKCIGTGNAALAVKISRKPVFFIGGINIANIDELLAKGAKNFAVIRAITEADDVESAARLLKSKIERNMNGKTA